MNERVRAFLVGLGLGICLISGNALINKAQAEEVPQVPETVVLSQEAIMQITERMARQDQLLREQIRLSHYWYRKYADFTHCVGMSETYSEVQLCFGDGYALVPPEYDNK